jgi:biopolymer transport protein TolR
MEAPGKQRGPKSEINITPLVDVVLVLLIIFIVVTPMLTRGADVVLPAANNAESKDDSSDDLIVSVTKTGEIWLGSALMTEDTLETELSKTMVAEPFKPILIKGDFQARYADARMVMAVCERSGAKNVSLMTDKDSTPEELIEQLREAGLQE